MKNKIAAFLSLVAVFLFAASIVLAVAHNVPSSREEAAPKKTNDKVAETLAENEDTDTIEKADSSDNADSVENAGNNDIAYNSAAGDEYDSSEQSHATTEAFISIQDAVENNIKNQPKQYTVSMNFVGDLLLATNEGSNYENCPEDVADRVDPSYLLSNFAHIFLNDSVTIGDCENVFTDNENLAKSDKGQAAAAEQYAAECAAAQAAGLPIPEDTFKAFWFRSKKDNAKILSTGGIDIVSIDNNHIRDFGAEGRQDTRDALTAAGVEYGESGKVVYKTIEGFTIGFVFGSMYSESAAYDISTDLEEAKANSDYQVVYFHGGEEAIHEPEQWKINACHILADNGADLILGDHPHVLQPYENYNGVNIIYSLGNFVFGGNRHPENRTIVFNQTLTVEESSDGAKEVVNEEYSFLPCYVYTGDTNNWQPAVIEDSETAETVIAFMNGEADSPLSR